MHKGGCLCGQVRYTMHGEPMWVSVCHCVTCRRASGATSVVWATFRLADFELHHGPLTIHRSSREVERGHCAACGASVTFLQRGEGTIDIAVATLDDPEAVPPDRDIWMDSRLSWEAVDHHRRHFARDAPNDG
jgi:hypothetical protein